MEGADEDTHILELQPTLSDDQNNQELIQHQQQQEDDDDEQQNNDQLHQQFQQSLTPNQQQQHILTQSEEEEEEEENHRINEEGQNVEVEENFGESIEGVEVGRSQEEDGSAPGCQPDPTLKPVHQSPPLPELVTEKQEGLEEGGEEKRRIYEDRKNEEGSKTEVEEGGKEEERLAESREMENGGREYEEEGEKLGISGEGGDAMVLEGEEEGPPPGWDSSPVLNWVHSTPPSIESVIDKQEGLEEGGEEKRSKYEDRENEEGSRTVVEEGGKEEERLAESVEMENGQRDCEEEGEKLGRCKQDAMVLEEEEEGLPPGQDSSPVLNPVHSTSPSVVSVTEKHEGLEDGGEEKQRKYEDGENEEGSKTVVEEGAKEEDRLAESVEMENGERECEEEGEKLGRFKQGGDAMVLEEEEAGLPLGRYSGPVLNLVHSTPPSIESITKKQEDLEEGSEEKQRKYEDGENEEGSKTAMEEGRKEERFVESMQMEDLGKSEEEGENLGRSEEGGDARVLQEEEERAPPGWDSSPALNPVHSSPPLEDEQQKETKQRETHIQESQECITRKKEVLEEDEEKQIKYEGENKEGGKLAMEEGGEEEESLERNGRGDELALQDEEEGPPPGWESVPVLNSVQQSSPVPEKGQMVCGSCRRLLSYFRGSKHVQCSCCQTINFVLEEHQVGQVKCGNCAVLLMYPYGAPSVRCCSCHFVTGVGEHNKRPPLSVQQSRACRPFSVPH